MAVQLAMFYEKNESKNTNYHVFDIDNLLNASPSMKYLSLKFSKENTTAFSKESFPVLKRIDYGDGLKKKLYADFVKLGKCFSLLLEKFDPGHFKINTECKLASEEIREKIKKIIEMIIHMLIG